MRRLNISVIMQSPDLGGAEIFMISLLKQFEKKGCKISLATNGEKFFFKSKNELNTQIYKIPFVLDVMGNIRGLVKTIVILPIASIYYIGLMIVLKKNRIDLILMSGFSEKLLVTMLSVLFKIPVFWIEYGPMETVFKRNFGLPKFLYRITQFIPKKIIVPSENTRNSLNKTAGLNLRKIKKIFCGINLRRVMRKDKDMFIIGSVSRLAEEKGQEYLVRSFPYVLKKIPNSFMYIVGDGPDRARLELLVRELGISGKVKITGFVQDVYEYYSRFDVFVFPSVWDLEGFGLATVEAMSQKIPVVGFSHGPVKEIVGEDGVLVENHSVRELANAVVKLGKKKVDRQKLGQKGYLKVLKNFNIEDVANKYLSIFYENI